MQFPTLALGALLAASTHGFLVPIRMRARSMISLKSSEAPDPPSSGDDEGLSFEEQIAKLNAQFSSGDPSDSSTDELPSAPSSAPDSDFTFASLSSASAGAGSSSSFSIPGAGIGVSTAYWGSKEKGFTVQNLPKSKAKGTHNPGDLQVAYSSLLNGDLTFLSAGEDENMSEELLGFFDSQNRLSVTAQVATTFVPKPLVFRKDQSKVLNPLSRASNGLFSSVQLRGGSKSVMASLQKSCDRLGVGYVFLYQADFSSSKSKVRAAPL